MTAALKESGALGLPFVVERPAAFAHGDYATNAALVAAKTLGKNPREIADAVAAALSGKIEGIEKIEVAGAGFINFHLTREALAQTVAHARETQWGSNDAYAGKMALVEYTSPNLFKPLHIGNLVGNIVGESVARLLAHSGADVARINYPSDIGLTVAKGVWGLAQTNGDSSDIKALGEAYRAGNAAYEDGSAKEKIEEINRALYEDSNPEWSQLRKQGIETSRRHLDELCRQLGTTFDKVFFESEAGPVGRELVRGHIGGVFEESEGAVIFRGAHTRVFLNSQGLPTYEAKELGLFELKSRAYPDFDISITVTGSEQKDFFAVVFEAIRRVFAQRVQGKELMHIATGFLRLTTGKMSSRLGNVITGESLIADLKEAATEKMRDRNIANAQSIAEQVAIAAIKYSVLRQGNGRDITFDPEKSLSLEGDSGPYLQYAHTRACSVLRKAEEGAVSPDTSQPHGDAHEVERLLVHFPDAVRRAALEKEPHYVTQYLTELASAFNAWYAAEQILDGTSAASYKLAVTDAARNTLALGLDLLGVRPPEQM